MCPEVKDLFLVVISNVVWCLLYLDFTVLFVLFSAYSSLAVRDLSNLVKPQDIVTSEHLETLLAIVPKYSERDWLSSYETLTTYVVKIPLSV